MPVDKTRWAATVRVLENAWRVFPMKPWLALGLLLSMSTAMAKDIGGQYAVHGVGAEPCAQYLTARDNGGGPELEYEIWLGGYFSAFNLIVSNTYSIMGDRSVADFFEALDEYCDSKPDTLFIVAVSEVLMVVFPERYNLSPHVDRLPNLLEDVGKTPN